MDHYEADKDATESDQEIDGIWRAEFKTRIEKWTAEDLLTAGKFEYALHGQTCLSYSTQLMSSL